ncbi:MAG: hypothetical protein EHM42_05880, partial [Planctomycetaceae bacterium]
MKVSDLSKYFFFLSLGLVIFGWGLAAERYKVFPSAVIARAQLALEALRKSRDASDIESDRYATRMSSEPLSAPRARRLAGNAGDNELILVAGGPDHLTELNPDGGCLAWIIDREGTVQHVWRNDLKQQRALCEEAQVSIAPGKSSVQVFPMGMHLYENGELLVTFIARGTFPYALALVKFDPDSQVVWTLPRRNHHWFSVDETGFIHVPYQDVSDAPYRLGESALMLTAEGDKIFNEGIMVVDPNGRVVEEFSLLDALVESGYPALFDKGKSDDVPT